MKRITISLGIIGVVAAAVIGGTIAYFNDTETSTGNILTAGALDLFVDHTYAEYNGEASELTIVSDTDDIVVQTGGNAVATWKHSAWTAVIPGATWIWKSFKVENPGFNETYTFRKAFSWNGAVNNAVLMIASDNKYSAMLNGNALCSDSSVNNFQIDTQDTCDAASLIENGTNTLEITVTNIAGSPSPEANPAGLLYRLDVNPYWLNPTDLTDETFFMFDDVKPGDYGLNIISLHVEDNDAYACLIPHNIEDDENGVTDPEDEAGDTADDGISYGELSGELEFFIWTDTNGNNQHDSGEEVHAPAGTPFNQIPTEIVAMSLTGGGPITFVGAAWCAGEQTGPQHSSDTTLLECDGSGMGDIAQTDILTADLVLYAEQQRNNPNFSCANITLP